ncbi:hypothetical protein [Streptomyces lincolnensis]|uniref:hypothetical protein n=1 Tax=Streptomyces lincolnensis TaxID=1915 RepID=UPI0037D3F1DF
MSYIDTTSLTQLQLDGVTCAICGQLDDRPMVPVGPAPSGLVDLYAHGECVEPTPWGVLVIGPLGTPADVEALREVACEIAYELGVATTYATHTDHSVTDFGAVYLTGTVTELRDAPTLVLVGEAIAAGIPVHDPLTADEVTECLCGLICRYTRPYVDGRGGVHCNECSGKSGCAWCGEWNDTEDLEFVESDDTWFPLHAECLAGIRATSKERALLATACLTLRDGRPALASAGGGPPRVAGCCRRKRRSSFRGF